MAYHPPNPPNRLKELRVRADLSTQKIAVKLGHSTSEQLAKLERGERPLSYGWMVEIAEVLGVRPSALIDADVELLPNAKSIGDLANDRLLLELLDLWTIISEPMQDELLKAVRANVALIRAAASVAA